LVTRKRNASELAIAHRVVTGNENAFQTGRRKDWECLHQKEMINVGGDRDVYLDLSFTQCAHIKTPHDTIFCFCASALKIKFNFFKKENRTARCGGAHPLSST
jgi:hypothetical protein